MKAQTRLYEKVLNSTCMHESDCQQQLSSHLCCFNPTLCILTPLKVLDWEMYLLFLNLMWHKFSLAISDSILLDCIYILYWMNIPASASSGGYKVWTAARRKYMLQHSVLLLECSSFFTEVALQHLHGVPVPSQITCILSWAHPRAHLPDQL